MLCEICGKNAPKTFYVELDGAVLSVCEECSKYGNIVEENALREVKPKRKIEVTKSEVKVKSDEVVEKVLDLKPDYYKIIKTEREKRKLTQEELAKLLNEKPSVISKIETGRFEPEENLIRKLEKFFNVRLVEVTELPASKPVFKSGELTLGEVVNLKKKKS
ncbi:MAG: multiprotein bridging factor aMBF1 [Candidatus Odinarchaeum yellowstonii]|uniref:Multiprotein bridging factor aMBF1 n=1 Tax=Odinarchaeota yellowstonii (strain LCB_4) TaxID=1841599 RepID=A0AAF0D2W5_ODILC|nr:MAG: multiprotein bridging factor aMBF1 [Candidatus Odinarchaeum yellowstonii]